MHLCEFLFSVKSLYGNKQKPRANDKIILYYVYNIIIYLPSQWHSQAGWVFKPPLINVLFINEICKKLGLLKPPFHNPGYATIPSSYIWAFARVATI